MFLVSIVIQARKNKVLTGSTGMIGEIGIARTELAPEGQVLIRGEYWDAVADAKISPGTRVRVKAVEDLKLRVEPA
jgi:membrane-bound serine protease (ClpP class)